MILIFNLFLQYFILSNIIFLSLISLMSLDMLLIWFIMEINNFLFVCYLSMTLQNKKMIFFYYLIQIMSSLMLIFSLSIMNIFMFKNFSLIIMIALIMKLGIPPFHLWMPIFSLYCSWNVIFFLLTIQKFIPFYMLSLFKINYLMMMIIIIFCSMIPPFMMMNSLNFKKLLTYSSINQLNWMILLIYFKNFIWMIYYMFYMLSLLITIMMFNKFNMKFNYYNKKYLNNNFYNYLIMCMILNIASMPPFSMFFMKWFSTLIFIINSNLFFIIIIMLISSFLMFYIYINMMIISMYFMIMKYKFFLLNNYHNFFYSFKIMMIMLMMFISFIFLMI